MALTPKQAKFAQCVASGMNQSAAYRVCYDVGEDTKPETVHQKAYELTLHGDVAARISELQMPIEAQVGITLQSHIERMQYLSKLAEQNGEIGNAIKADELTGKVLGYYVNKTELSGRGGGAIQHSITREILDPKEDHPVD